MAKCKVCNQKLDFDERDKSVNIGQFLKTVNDKLVKIPIHGKFAYVRRGRHYWHMACYPGKLTEPQSTELLEAKAQLELFRDEKMAIHDEKLSLEKNLLLHKGENKRLSQELAAAKKEITLMEIKVIAANAEEE